MSAHELVGELERLTMAERLLIDRRRRGETQAESARRYGVSQSRYSRWERGLDKPGREHTTFIWSPTRGDKLRGHERCLIYRRRVGFTQSKVAQDLKRCKMWVRQMERGEVDCTELVQYWEQ